MKNTDMAGPAATPELLQDVLDWFARHDRLVASGDPDAMADMAAFPLNEVTDDAKGHGMAGLLDRSQYLAQMAQVLSNDDVTMESTRQPIFLSPARNDTRQCWTRDPVGINLAAVEPPGGVVVGACPISRLLDGRGGR